MKNFIILIISAFIMPIVLMGQSQVIVKDNTTKNTAKINSSGSVQTVPQWRSVVLEDSAGKYKASIDSRGNQKVVVGDSVKSYLTHALTTTRTVVVKSIELTRSTVTSAYGAKTIFNSRPATIITITGAAQKLGGSGRITKVKVFYNDAAATNVQWRLHVYNGALVIGDTITDGGAFAMLYSKIANRVGMFDVVTAVEGSGSDCVYATNYTQWMDFVCDASSKDLQVQVENIATWTPASAKKITIEFTIVQD